MRVCLYMCVGVHSVLVCMRVSFNQVPPAQSLLTGSPIGEQECIYHPVCLYDFNSSGRTNSEYAVEQLGFCKIASSQYWCLRMCVCTPSKDYETEQNQQFISDFQESSHSDTVGRICCPAGTIGVRGFFSWRASRLLRNAINSTFSFNSPLTPSSLWIKAVHKHRLFLEKKA